MSDLVKNQDCWFSHANAQLHCYIIDDGDDAGDDVVIVRKGRGRPRGSDWRREYECPTCQKCFAQKGEKIMMIKSKNSCVFQVT